MIHRLTDANVDNVLKGSKTFVVLFYTATMPNISNIMAIFEDFDKQFQGKIDVYVCDVFVEKTKIPRYFNMKLLPGMLMIKNNKPYANISGPVSATAYNNAIKEGIIAIMAEDVLKEQISENFKST